MTSYYLPFSQTLFMCAETNTQRSFEYDVAFFLLGRDVALAQALADELRPLKCFVFAQNQRELVGRDGVETFADIFRRKTRLAVVLYRAGYGETDYTDIEARGIQDRGLETQWQSPVLINLDGTTPPGWFPKRNIWLDLTRYPVSEAVGAIRLRAEELGAKGRIESATEVALRLSERRAAEKARKNHERTPEALAEVNQEVQQLFRDLKSFVESNGSSLASCDPFFERTDIGVAITTRFGSLVVDWREDYRDSLHGAGMYVKLFDGYVSVGGRHAGRTPTMLSDTGYTPTYDEQSIWRWVPDDATRQLTTVELREQVLKHLVQIIFSRQQ